MCQQLLVSRKNEARPVIVLAEAEDIRFRDDVRTKRGHRSSQSA